MRKIRIFHLIKSLNRGGAETLLSEGLRFADRERFDLSYGFFYPAFNALVSTLVAGGAKVTCFGGENHVTMLARTRRVADHLRDEGIDLVHCHLPMAGVVGRLAARMAGVPVVYTEHNRPEWYRKPTFWLNAWTYGLQEQVIAVSNSVEESISTYIRPAVPVTVVRNGIDASCFRRAADDSDLVRKRFDIAPGAPVVGNVAALIPQKRLYDWVEAARLIHLRHPATRFLLVGEGPQSAGLVQRISGYGLEDVIHLGGVQTDVRPYLAAMDIYMMSSAYEGLPVALLEAMAMECAPVCTAVGGIPEVIVDGHSGFLTDSGRPEQLAEKVSHLLGDPARLRLVSHAARRTVENDFRVDRMTREVEDVYLDVLATRVSAPASTKLMPQLEVRPITSARLPIAVRRGSMSKGSRLDCSTQVLFLTKYDRKGASTRYRSLQYFPALEEAGIQCTFSPLFAEPYLEHRYNGTTPLHHFYGAAIRRIRALFSVNRYSAVVIEKELLPYFPAVFERFLARQTVPYIVDYDDALFHLYDQHSNPLIRSLFRDKIASVMRHSSLVIAGNQYLANYARSRGAPRVEVVPTVVDLARYPSYTPPETNTFTIGWIGSPSTTRYLPSIAPALASVCAGGRAKFLLIGAGEVRLPGVPVEVLPWSEQTEVADLRRFDVGIMPLADEPWERGKCGFKLIQYMASGLPVVASPVGANTAIVDADTGLFARTTDEWINALETLRADPGLRRLMGSTARARVERCYSLDVTAPQMIALIRSVTAMEGVPASVQPQVSAVQ